MDNKIYRSRYLIIADGSKSIWSTYLKLGPKRPKYANTLSLRLNNVDNLKNDSVRFEFGLVKYGYAWAFPFKNGLNVGLGTFLGNNQLKDDHLIQKVIKGFGSNNIPFKIVRKKLRIWNGKQRLHGKRVLTIGDAASLCDPFLAEGIRPSLMSSFFASDCIDKCLMRNDEDLSEYSNMIYQKWGKSMVWGKRIAEVFYRFPRTGYQLGIKRKTAPQRIAQILSGEMSYEDIAKRAINRLLFKSN